MSQIWFFWLMNGIWVLILVTLGITIWMLYEYFKLPGHYDIRKKLIGEIGTVKAEVTAHKRGKVYVAGAYWDAVCEHGMIAVDRDIEIIAVSEKFLVVKPVDLTGDRADEVSNL